MTRQEAVDRLTVSLADVIEKWTEQLNDRETPEWAAIGWFPEDGARLMARAAMTAVEFGAGVQEVMENNGIATE